MSSSGNTKPLTLASINNKNGNANKLYEDYTINDYMVESRLNSRYYLEPLLGFWNKTFPLNYCLTKKILWKDELKIG